MRVSALSLNKKQSSTYTKYACGCFLYAPSIYLAYLQKRWRKEIKSRKDKNGNAALLLSDQNPTISKFAVFQGTTVNVFLDKKEFTGSILKQLDEVLYFANLSNRKKITITGKPDRDE